MEPDRLAGVLETLRVRNPLVQCLTNTVVQGFTANVLLAAGASPAMVDNPVEAPQFASIASAVLVNVGTINDETERAMLLASDAARRAGVPWVLDPVAVGGLQRRTTLAVRLLDNAPTVIRGNASEVMSLAGAEGGGRGVDSGAAAHTALDQAVELTTRTGGAVAVSGEVDMITDGLRTVRVHNGVPMMTQVTGVGCALGALVAACAGVEKDPLVAATAATAILTVAAERAREKSAGPGSFAVGLLDELAALSGDQLAAGVRL